MLRRVLGTLFPDPGSFAPPRMTIADLAQGERVDGLPESDAEFNTIRLRLRCKFIGPLPSNITILQPSELLKSDTVEELLLSFNHIIDIKPSSLQLPQLKRLDLSHNELQVIQPGVFVELLKLESLNLANNKFTHISRLDFHPLVNLKEIILDGNNIGRDLFDTSLFDPNGCGLTNAIQSISLNKINLQDVRREYFLQADKLSNLSLSGNNITTIPYFKQLLHLDLSDNPIEVLEFDQTYPPIISVFKINNLKIKEISMNGLLGLFNEIEMESNRHLSNFSHLAFGSNILRDDYDFITRKLSMRSSNLSSLDERLWVLFKHLEVLDLQDNPWHCDCRISWFLKLNIPLILSQELK
ncbi:putative leucine-rich transmembrane protein [Danaus plexippus plexippus]|uniref:Leucine-rich transmembrane protein n=1 Tax=Danaus plexippus plexippus TaxID=278856 RepID=A0A212EPH1_DANPL|nr:putative leucine-rich transmembrane protein [Danaus plexippus plexippus]